MNIVCYYNSKGQFKYYNTEERKAVLQYELEQYKHQLKKYKNKEETHKSLELKNRIILTEFRINHIEEPFKTFTL